MATKSKGMPYEFWKIVVDSQTGGIRQLASQCEFVGDDGKWLTFKINKVAFPLVEAFGMKLCRFCNRNAEFVAHGDEGSRIEIKRVN